MKRKLKLQPAIIKLVAAGFLALSSSMLFSGCEKFLDAKPDIKLSTPETLSDLEALLDGYSTLNARCPSAGEVSSDNYYLTNTDWAAVTERHRNLYLWVKSDDIGGDWSTSYNVILHANVILENLDKIVGGQKERRNQIKGSALFIRAFYHFQLSQLFALPFDSLTAKKDLGIPIRLNSDMNVTVSRAKLSETYDCIINDLKNATALLPEYPSLKYRPSRPAAYGLLSRVYLSMRQYISAGLYADSCLRLYDKLMDYNTINPSVNIPFEQFNDEVIYDARTSAPSALNNSRAKIDTVVYSLYADGDLRKMIFFTENRDGSHAFKGNYTGISNASLFTGIATDEVYLTLAECYARQQNPQAACTYLNRLMLRRFRAGEFTPFEIQDSDEVLLVILEERRKELLFRNLRWTDIRRLNKEQQFAITLRRKIDGNIVSLEPESPRYVLQIDRASVEQSGLEQNP